MFSIESRQMIGIIKSPTTENKLDILTASAKYDVCLSSCAANPRGGSGRSRNPVTPLQQWIYPAAVPGKGHIAILKVLQTNVCSNHCSYCSLAAGKDTVPRMGFSSSELARVFMEFYRKKLVEGIFLSSGIGFNAETAMERMITTARILRQRYHFRGYIHLKVLPGCSYSCIEAAARYADRLSLNLEAPTRKHLAVIAPEKQMAEELIKRMKWTGDLIQKGMHAKSQTTQFVVGAAGESDLEIMKAVDWVYRELFVYRAYFSAYQSIVQTGRKNPATLLREHRLYQCDFLLRGYGFRLHDLVFTGQQNIPLDLDPKTAYAVMHPEIFPVDINRAEENLLLKVPGIGPLSARRIIQQRKKDSFHNLAELRRTGAIVSRAACYVEFSGRRDACYQSEYKQGLLFEEEPGKGWQTGFTPYQGEKLTPGSSNQPYPYPGQEDKPLGYTGKREKTVYCR